MRRTLSFAAIMALAAGLAHADGAGITWAGKSSMADRVHKGFVERMAEIAPDIAVETRGPLADFDALAAAVTDFHAAYGAAVVLRSNGSEWLAANGAAGPTFIGGGNYPPALGVIQNMAAPEGQITGVTYYLEPVVVLETLSAIKPIETLLILNLTGHPGSAVEQAEFPPACGDLFIECRFVEVAAAAGMAEAIAANADVSAILVGNQTPLFDDAAAFDKALEAAGTVPVFGLTDTVAKRGGLAALGADDVKLGRMLADRYVAVMRGGKTIADTPVGTDDSPVLYLNGATMERLGIEVPRQMLDAAVSVGAS